MSHPKGTWPDCEHCFGPNAKLNYHASRRCMMPDEYFTPCIPSKINPSKCEWLLHLESIMKCQSCFHWASKVWIADWGFCDRCMIPARCSTVNEENRAYAKSKGKWDGWHDFRSVFKIPQSIKKK